MVIGCLVDEKDDDKFPVDESPTAGSILKYSFSLIEEGTDGMLEFGGRGDIRLDAALGWTGGFLFVFFLSFFFLLMFFLFLLKLENFSISQVIIIHDGGNELIDVGFGRGIVDFILVVDKLMELMVG